MPASDRRAALVTGAASGIGRAVAARLESDGLDVLAVDIKPDPDGPGTPHEADLSTREGNEGAVKAALDAFGRLDVIVPNAGVQHVAPVREFPPEKWQLLISLMLTSPFLLSRHAWDALAKSGVLGLVKTLALEGADAGICATAVCPAFVRTPLMERQIPDQAKAHEMSEERVLEEVILAPHAVKRLIETVAVAAPVPLLPGPDGF